MSSTHLQTGIRQRSLRRHCRLGRATELVFVLAAGATLVLGGQGQAQTVTWTGAGANDSWITPGNWDGSAIPDGTSNVIINANPITFLGTASTVNSTTISGTGVLEVVGAGASLTSNAIVTAGTLQVGGPGGGTLTGSVDLGGGSVLLQGTGTITGAITVTGGTANLAGTVIGTANVNGGTFIANASGFTLSGLATVSGGTLSNNGGALNGGVSMSGGAFNNAGNITGAINLSGGTMTLNPGSNLSNTVALTVNGGTLNMQTSSDTVSAVTLSTGSITGTGTLTSTSTFDVRSGTVSARLGGAVGLTKTGTDTVTLSGNNTYTGQTRVDQGTLIVANGSALGGTAEGTIVANGATLVLDFGVATSEPITLNGQGVNNTGALRAAGDNQVSGVITLATDARINTTSDELIVSGNIVGANTNLTVGGAGRTSINGAIQTGTGSLTVDAVGTGGIVTLSAVNTFTGGTTVNSGFLQLVNANSLADSGALIVNEDGTVQVLSVAGETIGSLAGSGSVILENGAPLIVGDANDTEFSGVISEFGGTGRLVKQGNGRLVLSGANTFTGAVDVNAGTLALIDGGSLVTGGASQIFLANGSTLETDGGALQSSLTLIVQGTGTTVRLTGDETVRAISMAPDTILDLDGGTATILGNPTLAGNVTGSGGITVAGAGQTVRLAGSNDYTGVTTITNGATLQIINGNAIGDESAVNLVSGTIALLNTETIGNLTAAAGTITLNDNTLTVNGTVANNVAAAVNGDTGSQLVKNGAGAMTLTGVIDTAGRIMVNNGTLVLSNGANAIDEIIVAETGPATTTLRLAASGAAGGATIRMQEGVLELADGTVNNSTVTLEGDTVQINVTNAGDTATQAGEIAEDDLSRSLTKIGGGRLILTGSNSYSGPTTVQQGTLALNGGAAINDAGAVSVELDAILRVLASERIGTLTNRGTVTLSDDTGTTGTILTVAGNYDAASDLVLDVVLAGDGSASDRLVVEGGTTGTTNVFVINRDGTGARTTTGIMIVDVQGSSAGDFVLANGDVALSTGETGLSAGNYVYVLRNVAGDWYLQSQLQPTTVVLEALPAALIGQSRAQSLAQRMGGRQIVIPADAIAVTRGAGGMTTPQPGVWFALQGTQAEATPDGSSTGLSYDQSSWRLQTGVDIGLYDNAAGALTGGFSVFVGGGNLDAASSVGAGTISSDMHGIGLHATWQGNGGLYADLQMEYGLHETDVVADGSGPLIAGLEGIGRMASVEIGQTFVQDNGLTWTPQAQLSWSDIRIDSFATENGEAVAVEDSENLRLRLGLAGEKAWSTGPGPEPRLYGIANLIHEFAGDSRVLVDDTALEATTAGWTAEVGFGGTYTWGDDTQPSSVFGEVTASRAVSGGEMTGLSGSLGLRVSW